MKQFYIYIKCKPDGTPFYVGKGFARRAWQYFGRNRKFNNVVNKYGKANILTYVFYEESEELAFDGEIAAIKSLREAGYDLSNLTDGGEGVSGFNQPKSEEHRRNMCIAQRGKKKSPDHVAKMAESAKKQYAKGVGIAKINGLPRTEEHCKNLSESHMGNTFSLGHKHSEESKRKMSLAKKGKPSARQGYTHSEETRRKIGLANTKKRNVNEISA